MDARSGELILAILGTIYTRKLRRIIFDRSLRPCLRNGASRRARVGRVRRPAVLSILHNCTALALARITHERSSPQPLSPRDEDNDGQVPSLRQLAID